MYTFNDGILKPMDAVPMEKMFLHPEIIRGFIERKCTGTIFVLFDCLYSQQTDINDRFCFTRCSVD